ncbi:MAG TPA: hypothetical protein VFX02_04880 [Gammaproteobacteria bacterium]|nr:hypothetical protein [Gammaproteobacteria bacterium]
MTSFRCFWWGAFGAFVVLLAAAILVPQYADYKDRAANTASYDESLMLRESIAARIIELGSVENSGTNIQAPADAGYKAVTRDGAIILQGRYGHVLVLTPSLDQGAVTWKCVGGPPKDMPRPCRPE